MKMCTLLRSLIVAALLPCAAWSATLTVTVTNQTGAAITTGIDVVAVSFSSMGPVGAQLQPVNGSGQASFVFASSETNRNYQIMAVGQGYLPSARDQMMNWTSSVYMGSADAAKTIQVHQVTTESVRDIQVTVVHDIDNGKLIFLNLTNKGTMEQSGMGYLKCNGASQTAFIYSAPVSSEDMPFQLDVFKPDPANPRGGREDVENKPGAGTNTTPAALNISSTGGGMAPPTRQIVSDEKLGPVAIEGRVIDPLKSPGSDGIEGVNVNINSMGAATAINFNTQTDQNGYFAFYENADATNKYFANGVQYGVNFNKNGYSGTWISTTTNPGGTRTLIVPMAAAHGRIKGIVNIKFGDTLIPIPQAWINAWGDGHNYGTSNNPGPGYDRNQGMGNAGTQINKGSFVLEGLSSGRYTLNLWSQFSNQPVIFNNGADGVAAVESNQWNISSNGWGNDLIVQIDTTNPTPNEYAYARVFQAASTNSLAASTVYNDTTKDLIITITKTPDGTNSIAGQITFTGSSTEIDPASVLIVANENTSGGGMTQPKSGFTVLKTTDRVSANVYNYSITGLANTVYNLSVSAPVLA